MVILQVCCSEWQGGTIRHEASQRRSSNVGSDQQQPVYELFWLCVILVACMFVAIACAAVFNVSDYLSEKHSGTRIYWQQDALG